MNDIENKVKNLISDKLGLKKSQVSNNSILQIDLGADSLDFVDLIISIENMFKVDIPDGDLKGIETVNDVIDYLRKRIDLN
jgi:acyl carrier protein